MEPMHSGGRLLLGVDLGAAQIKLAEAARAGEGRTGIRQWTELPPPDGSVQMGQVVPGSRLAEGLRAAVEQLGPEARRAAVGLSAQTVLVRRVAMPRLPAVRLRRWVELHGDQWIPFFHEGAYFDLRVTDPELSEHEQEVLLVAVPAALVRGLQATLRAAGLRLAALDVSVIAVYRAAAATGLLDPEQTTAVLDVGARRSTLGLFRAGIPLVVRTLESVPLPAEAARLPDVEYRGALEFAASVRRSLEVALGHERGAGKLGALLLCARDQDLAGLLQAELQDGLADRLEPAFAVRTARDAGLPAPALQALGLALAGAHPPLPPSLLPRLSVAAQRERRTLAAVFGGVLVGAGIYLAWWSQAMPAQQVTAARLQGDIAAHQAYLGNTDRIRAEEVRRKQLEPVRRLVTLTNPWSLVYPQLKELLPDGVAVDELGGRLPALDLRGRAPDAAAVAALLQRLLDSPYFDAPQLVSYDPGGGGEVSFRLTVNLSPREATP